MNGLGKTIRNGRGFERVRLTQEELEQVHSDVMEYNFAVVRECIERTDKEFAHIEPPRRLSRFTQGWIIPQGKAPGTQIIFVTLSRRHG